MAVASTGHAWIQHLGSLGLAWTLILSLVDAECAAGPSTLTTGGCSACDDYALCRGFSLASDCVGSDCKTDGNCTFDCLSVDDSSTTLVVLVEFGDYRSGQEVAAGNYSDADLTGYPDETKDWPSVSNDQVDTLGTIDLSSQVTTLNLDTLGLSESDFQVAVGCDDTEQSVLNGVTLCLTDGDSSGYVGNDSDASGATPVDGLDSTTSGVSSTVTRMVLGIVYGVSAVALVGIFLFTATQKKRSRNPEWNAAVAYNDDHSASPENGNRQKQRLRSGYNASNKRIKRHSSNFSMGILTSSRGDDDSIDIPVLEASSISTSKYASVVRPTYADSSIKPSDSTSIWDDYELLSLQLCAASIMDIKQLGRGGLQHMYPCAHTTGSSAYVPAGKVDSNWCQYGFGTYARFHVANVTACNCPDLDVILNVVRVSGFKRILVRLDEGTRRKYCCRALEQDLQHVKSQMRACTAAMGEAKQVEDATRKLHASQRAPVSSELLDELEMLQRQLETATNTLLSGWKPQNGTLDMAKEDLEVKEEHLERLMPVLKEVDDKKKKWWKKYVQKVVAHTLELAKGDGKADKRLARLDKSLKKIEVKCPELNEWLTNVKNQIEGLQSTSDVVPVSATKSKKKRAIALPDDGETALTTSTASSAKPKKAKSGDSTKEKKAESVEKARALLHRCSREVRTLRDKFELGAYDVNLSRMVTVVDSLWSGVEHSELVSLTTALFTLVETVEKVVHQAKRRDRLMCLESVLGVVLGSSKLQLTARRKTMVEEYVNNCRQSLEQLNRQSDSADEQPAACQDSVQNAVPTAARSHSSKANGGSHVRFG
ncbi:hypothetical protein GQ600_8152 [Phytophthora cactorum]|nr:hypothetical protein GQ600_8152 [Phytophthora cactorum]